MELNKEQAEAVQYLDGPLLVLAGPGTGKTQLLSTKVAYILEHTDTNPENILCLTFTESGASNMRERLGSIIGRAAANVNIYTYHAFGSNILDRYRNYAENFDRRLDSVIDDVTQYKYLREIQSQLPAIDILKTANIKDLADTIQHAKSARLTADDLAHVAEQNITDSQDISLEASSILQNLVPRMKFDLALAEIYQPLLVAISKYSSPDPITKNIERTANLLTRELSDLIKTEQAKEKPSISSLTTWKNQRFERSDDGSYRLKDHIANKKLASLAEVMRRYDQKLRDEGLFDFADMIEESIRVLKEDRGFRLSLSEVFQYVLLDEFQDTNPSQFELIKLITDYERPAIMAVGDDDQAIFAFQGANASNLLDFQNYYQANVITLLDNYRSTGEILDFSHQIAEQVNESFAKHHGVVKILRSMLDIFNAKAKKTTKLLDQQGTNGQSADPSSAPNCQIERHEFLTASDEYYWLAREISQLIKHGEDPAEIAVIAAKHKYIAPLLPYLKAHKNINVAYEKRSNLLEDPKLHELIVISEFVSDLATEKQPSHRLLEILSFPFLEVEPIVAIRAVEQARTLKRSALDYLLESNNEKLQQIAKWLADLVVRSFDTPLELWLDYLIGSAIIPGSDFRSPYLAYYQGHSSDIENFEFYENLSTLRDTVINHTQNPRPKLADFIEMIDDYTEASATIINTTPYQDGEHAVQIMSAHKSKGLEFKHVFMIAVDEMGWGKAKGNNNLFSLPNNLAQIRHTGITDDEQLRLLFVAITRAKQHLVMTNSITDFSNKIVARLGYLDEVRDEKAEQQLSPYLPPESQGIKLHYQDFDLNTKLEAGHQGWTAAYQILTPDLKTLLRSRLKNYRLTATDLTDFIDLIYAGPDRIYQKCILQAPDEPLTPQLAYGNLIHATFEQVTNNNTSDNEAIEYFREKTLDQPLTLHEIQELQEKGAYSLEIALKAFHDTLHSPGSKAEVNLSAEHLSYDGVPLTGKIDHINIDPEAKTIEVYDFKTSNYRDNKWQSHPTLYKYSLQLEFYKLLLNLSPTYRNYQVTKGHILFVSPDSDDRVYDKVYEYNPDSMDELKELVKVVYQQITSLDFINNPAINLPADKSHTLKDIREFIKLLLNLKNQNC